MIMFYLIIFVISMVQIETSDSSKQLQLFQTSCQQNNHQLKSILINSSIRKYYFAIVNRANSNRIFFAYCEHSKQQQQQQQPTTTTSYSSSGFAILYSSPYFLFSNINKSERIPSIVANNDILLHVNQSFSLSTVMSSNENNPQINSDPNTTLIHSFLSTTTTTLLTNITLNQNIQHTKFRTRNLTLLIGCLVGCVILIIIVIYAFIKYRNRDEGSYKIDESKNFISNSPLPKHEPNAGASKVSSATHHRQKLLANHEQNGIDSREWYV